MPLPFQGENGCSQKLARPLFPELRHYRTDHRVKNPDHSQNHTNRCPGIDNFRYRELQLEVEDGRHLFASWRWYGDRARSQVGRKSHLQHVGRGLSLNLQSER
jgi:hypothetical protein